MNQSWKPEVITDASGQWCDNSLRFATREEARLNVENLASRWFAVRETRTVESPDPPNYQWLNGELVAIPRTDFASVTHDS